MDSQKDLQDFDKDTSTKLLSKSKKKDSPSLKKASGLVKLASKVTRKRSLKKEKQEQQQQKKISADDPVFTSPPTADKILTSDKPAAPAESRSSGVTLPHLSKSSSKSEDSLDSGIYSSTGSTRNSTDQLRPVMSYTTAGDSSRSTEEYGGGHQMNTENYDDYWREYQDIRRSIAVHDDETEEKRVVTRTDSGEDEDDSDWFMQAGLAGLMTTASLSPSPLAGAEKTTGNSSARLSTDSLTSMTILSTLTRPQREAVLRRITSFNRAQKSRRRPLHAVFPRAATATEDPTSLPEGLTTKPPMARPSNEAAPDVEKSTKSTSLPHNLAADYIEPYQQRRFSEAMRSTEGSSMTNVDGHFSSMVTAFSTSSLDSGHIMKLGQKGYQKMEPLHSIVATETTGGIETLSIQLRSPDDTWHDNFMEDSSNKTKQPMSYSETADQENLPNFSLVKDRLGITRISDLSSPDMRKVQSLALIELTALFDLHNIDLKRKKYGKVKPKETGVFGIPLTTLLEWDQKRQSNTDLRVPLVLQETIAFLIKNGLTDEGILRVPGSAVRIKNLKQELEIKFGQTAGPIALPDPNAGWNEARTNDVAALLKQFLRELPNPLLTSEYIDAFQSCDLIPDRKQALQALNLLIILLDEVHRDSLKLLLKFLSRVIAKEEMNKMSLNNVAMIMAPNLFLAKKQTKRTEISSASTASQDVKHAAGTSNVVRMLIKYHKLLWTVPTFMLTQVRNMNKAEQSSKKHHGSTKDKKLKFPNLSITKTKDHPSKASKSPLPAHDQFDYEVPKGVIRVKVENHSMTSMAVQVDVKTTAGDVIGKFQKQCERAKQMSPDSDITVITNQTHALYEIGGNIFERCLDLGTNMHALTKINPEASWVIKKRTNH